MDIFFEPTRYRLKSVATGKIFDDTGWLLDAPGENAATLVRAEYAIKQLRLHPEQWGLYRFADWLPVNKMLAGSSAPITYKSDAMAAHLGLEQLYITFSGYWPEKEATMTTCSFKETEAYSVCGRMDETMTNNVLVVASAGNTARAFAKVCSDNHIPLMLCVPFDNLNALWFDQPLNACVQLVCTPKGSDYFDAIHVSNLISSLNGFYAEGGAKNIARRDGMATTMLSATTFIGRIPDYYFQAVGSGTGAIAAWEANLRLLADGRFGNRKMKLMVSQNIPFQPIYEAWKAGSRAMLPYSDDDARAHVETIDAKVLSNRRPPYPVVGGLFDALQDTQGEVLLVDNTSARAAAILFEELEGIDIHPAAAVAVASLMQTVKSGDLPSDAVVMLNITGGGEARFKAEHELFYLKPALVLQADAAVEEVRKAVAKLSWTGC